MSVTLEGENFDWVVVKQGERTGDGKVLRREQVSSVLKVHKDPFGKKKLFSSRPSDHHVLSFDLKDGKSAINLECSTESERNLWYDRYVSIVDYLNTYEALQEKTKL